MPRLSAVLEKLGEHRWTIAFLASCLMAFLGPTYVIYALTKLDLEWPIPSLVGFSLFIVGFLLLAYTASRGFLKPES